MADFSLYTKLNKGIDQHSDAEKKAFSSSIKKTKTWSFDKNTGRYVIVDGQDVDVQQVIDSYRGNDIKSILNRQPGNTMEEKLNSAIDKGLLMAANLPAEDVDLSDLPTDKKGLIQAHSSGVKAVDSINQEIGGDFDLNDYISGVAQKAIDDYLTKKKAAASAAKEDTQK